MTVIDAIPRSAPRVEDFDESAWSDLVARYSGLLRATAATFRLTPAEAEDAAQTTWLRLVQHAASVRDPERVGGWLRVTMRRTCLTVVKQRQREKPFDGLFDWPLVDSAPPPETRVLHDERNAVLWAAVAELPDRQRQLVQALFATSEPSYDEISAALSIPLGGIGPTRGRALCRLRSTLGQSDLHANDLL